MLPIIRLAVLVLRLLLLFGCESAGCAAISGEVKAAVRVVNDAFD